MKSRVSEICVNQIRINQGVGKCLFVGKQVFCKAHYKTLIHFDVNVRHTSGESFF